MFLHAICVFVLCVSIVMHFKKLFSVVWQVLLKVCSVMVSKPHVQASYLGGQTGIPSLWPGDWIR